MKYCPQCKEERAKDLKHCSECFTELVERPSPIALPERLPSATGERDADAPVKLLDRLRMIPPTDESEEVAPDEVEEGPPEDRADYEEEDYFDLSPEAEKAYEEVTGEVKKYMQAGYDLFGFAGHPASGKTHCLKALSYLLDEHGFEGAKIREKFRRIPVPGTSRKEIFDAVFTSGQRKWVFVDAGGELYEMIQANDWTSIEPNRTKLTQWLHSCKGLFLFLHLHRGHFSRWLADYEVDAFQSASANDQQFSRSVERARDQQKELEFFGHFLLFLRALKHEDGNVAKIIAQCRGGESLEDSLRSYTVKAPLLDIPVMFFFSKADAFDPGFELSKGIHLTPRSLPMPATLFAARYLPGIFGSLLDHTRWFKFDFLQSYEEFDTGQIDAGGMPVVRTAWNTPDDQTPLSVGLMSGLEFVLRHQGADDGAWWRGTGLETRRTLQLHRLLHPGLWKGVKVDLVRRR